MKQWHDAPHAAPPSEWVPGSIDLGHDVYALVGETSATTYVWHWCQKRRDGTGGWEGAAVPLHTMLSREPLTLDPSLACPNRCPWHGYVRAGRWQPV